MSSIIHFLIRRLNMHQLSTCADGLSCRHCGKQKTTLAIMSGIEVEMDLAQRAQRPEAAIVHARLAMLYFERGMQ